MLKINSKAPSFTVTSTTKNKYSLKDSIGKYVVLYFYPKDDTPCCTKEACNLRDNYQELKNNNFEVIGVSADNSTKHLKFIDKYELPFSLIADTDKSVINAYQCWGLKKFMGREYDGILRKTFVIENNTIVKLFEKVKTADHFQQIMEALD